MGALPPPPSMSVTLNSSFVELGITVHKKFPTLPGYRITAELQRLRQITDSTRNLVGKKIMDIGCGSKNSKDVSGGLTNLFYRIFDPHVLEQFEPWYCRIAHEAHADVTGLDIEPNKEEFSTIQADILQPDAFSQFADKSFDAINNYKCTIPKNSCQARTGCSPAIMKRFGMDLDAAFDLDNRVRAEVERLLCNGGTYTVAEFVYQKKRGSLRLNHVMKGLGS